MKNINSRAYRTWFGGGGTNGGGGGGGCCYTLTTQAALQALQSASGMDQGTMYQITDVTADWQVVVLAVSANKIAVQGQGIYQNVLFTDVEYDLNFGALERVYDPLYNNEVEGQLNIAAFSWNNPDWNNNKIVGSSQVLTSGATIPIFKSNVISNSVVDLADSNIGTFSYNIISGNSTLTANSSTFTIISTNVIEGNSTLAVDGTTAIGVIDTLISAASFVLAQNATIGGGFFGNKVIGNSSISLSFVTLTGNVSNNALDSNSAIGGDTTTSLAEISANNLSSGSYINLSGFVNAACTITYNNLDSSSNISFTGANSISTISKNNLSSNGSINDSGLGGATITQGIVENNVVNGNIYLYTCTVNKVIGNTINVGTLFFAKATCTGNIESNNSTRGAMVFGNTSGTGSFVEIKANNVAGGYQDTGNLVVYGDITMGNTIYDNTITGGSDINLQGTVNVPNGILYNSLDGLSRIRFKNGCSLSTIEGNTLSGESKIRDNNAGLVTITNGIVNNTLTNSSDILCQLCVLNIGLNKNNLSNGILKLINAGVDSVIGNTIVNSSVDLTGAISVGSFSYNELSNVTNLNCTGGIYFANFDYNIMSNCTVNITLTGGSNINQFTHNKIINPQDSFTITGSTITSFSKNEINNCSVFNASSCSLSDVTGNNVLSGSTFDISGSNQSGFSILDNTLQNGSEFYVDATTTLNSGGTIEKNTISNLSILDCRAAEIRNNVIENTLQFESNVVLNSISIQYFKYNTFEQSTFSCPKKSATVIDSLLNNSIRFSTISIVGGATIFEFSNNQINYSTVDLFSVNNFMENIMESSMILMDDSSSVGNIQGCIINNASTITINASQISNLTRVVLKDSSGLTFFISNLSGVFQDVSINNASNIKLSNTEQNADFYYINISNESSFTISNFSGTFLNPVKSIKIDNYSLIYIDSCANFESLSNISLFESSSFSATNTSVTNASYISLKDSSQVNLSGKGIQLITYLDCFHSFIDYATPDIEINQITFNTIYDSYVTVISMGSISHNFIKNSIPTFDLGNEVFNNCQLENITATIQVGQNYAQAIGNVMSNMEANLNMDVDYDSKTITIPSALKDYIGIFNCIEDRGGVVSVNTIVNAPTTWEYKLTNQSDDGGTIRLNSTGDMKGCSVVSMPVNLILKQDFAIIKDYSGVSYISQKAIF